MVGQHNIVQEERPAEEVVWASYSTPIERLRRIQLWRLADIHKVPFPPGCTREIMLRLLENKTLVEGLDAMNPPQGMTAEVFWSLINGPSKQYNEYGGASQDRNTNVDVMRHILEGKSYFEMEEAAQEEPTTYSGFISSLSWGELKKEASNQGIKMPNTMKRAELEALLNGQNAS